MKKVPLSDVAPGGIVARPVVTSGGVVLVQPGTVLTAEILSRLADLRVETVCLEGVSEDARPVEQLLQELDRRFAGHEQDELMMALKALVAARVAPGAR
jgi:hypothetical protein